MKIIYSSKFARQYRKLPFGIKLKAEKRELIFRNNPRDPRLKTHKLKGMLSDFFAFSVDFQYRIIFEFKDSGVVWFHSIGTHELYDPYG